MSRSWAGCGARLVVAYERHAATSTFCSRRPSQIGFPSETASIAILTGITRRICGSSLPGDTTMASTRTRQVVTSGDAHPNSGTQAAIRTSSNERWIWRGAPSNQLSKEVAAGLRFGCGEEISLESLDRFEGCNCEFRAGVSHGEPGSTAIASVDCFDN